MITLGFFIDGEYYERIGNENHIQIANRIFASKKFWKAAFEQQDKYDPVDYLIHCKGAIKIGNRYGIRIVSYSGRHLNKQMEGVLLEYQSRNWRVEDVYVFGV